MSMGVFPRRSELLVGKMFSSELFRVGFLSRGCLLRDHSLDGNASRAGLEANLSEHVGAGDAGQLEFFFALKAKK